MRAIVIVALVTFVVFACVSVHSVCRYAAYFRVKASLPSALLVNACFPLFVMNCVMLVCRVVSRLRQCLLGLPSLLFCRLVSACCHCFVPSPPACSGRSRARCCGGGGGGGGCVAASHGACGSGCVAASHGAAAAASSTSPPHGAPAGGPGGWVRGEEPPVMTRSASEPAPPGVRSGAAAPIGTVTAPPGDDGPLSAILSDAAF